MNVRPIVENDVPGVAALFARVRPDHGWSTRGECEQYFRFALFRHPWRQLHVPSWAVEDGGRIVGFYLLMPRPMSLRGRSLVAAVGCQIAVEPEPRYALAALQLVQACLGGPQDLTFADGADQRSREMWLAISGAAPTLLNLAWTRLLRPARYALALLEEHAIVPPLVARAARPLSVPADAFAAGLHWNRRWRKDDELVERTLDGATMFAYLGDVVGDRALRPVYDHASLAWVLDEAARKTNLGEWRARSVHRDHQLLGWYLYYARRGGLSEVVQVAARDGAFDAVLQRLLADAWHQGAAAVRGRVDPRYLDELSANHCWFRREGTSVLAHSRNADVLEALQRGDTFLSRLEGEWYLRFLDG
jgi:hypothetical protein